MGIKYKTLLYLCLFVYFCLIAIGISQADYGDDLICYPIIMSEEGLTVDQTKPVKHSWDYTLTEEENYKIIEIKLGEDFVCVIDENV